MFKIEVGIQYLTSFSFHLGNQLSLLPSIRQSFLPLWIYRITFVIDQESRKERCLFWDCISSSPSIPVLILHCYNNSSFMISLNTERSIMFWSFSPLESLVSPFICFHDPLTIYSVFKAQYKHKYSYGTFFDRPFRIITFNPSVLLALLPPW